MKVALTEKDKSLIRAFQNGLPVTSRPYTEVAQKTGWDTDQVLQRVQELKN